MLRPKALGRVEVRLDRGDDRFGDLVLHGKYVGDVAVVALGPQMAAGGDVIELRGNAHPIAAAANAALDDVADAELARDLVDVGAAALVDKRGVARDDEEPPQLGQRGDDVLADPVGKIILGLVAAHVDEGQHGDAGPVAQRHDRLRHFVARRRGRFCRRHAFLARLHVCDEAESLSCDGADQRLRAAAVADRLARSIDPAGQGRLRDMSSFPDFIDQFFLADDAIAVLHEMDDEIEHLRLERDRHVLPTQLTRVGIKHLI